MDMGNQVGLRFGRRPTKRLASLLIVALFQTSYLTLPAAYAQSEASRSELSKQVAFNIPAGFLSAALLQVGQQAGIRLSVNAQSIKGINVSGFKELMTAQGALDVLLDGTGLVYEIDPSGIIIISSLQDTVSDGGGDPSLLPVVVTASSGDAAGWQGAPEWVYETPRAISVIGRDEIKNSNARGAADLFAGVPGVNVADNPQDPGISINIRGLQDQNRVNVMIDGARQNFQKAGHSEVGRFYIDPAFVKQVEIEKSATSGVGGAGAMGGIVNFRTIEASDLMKSDKSYGVEGKLGAGTNAYNFNGNLAAGVEFTENISFAAGISKKNLGKYESGSNGSLKYSETGKPVVFTGSEALSWLTKLNLRLGDDHELVLGALGFHDAFTNSTVDGGFRNNSDVSNITGTATYTWQPDDNWFDLEAKIWANHTQNDQERTARTGGPSTIYNDVIMQTFGGSLQNTSEFDFRLGNLSWNVGVEAFYDDGDRKTKKANLTNDPDNVWFGTDPVGTRSVFSAFNQLTFEHNEWLELGAGLRYDQFQLKGDSTFYRLDNSFLPSLVKEYIENSGNRLSPTFSVAITPLDGLQFFGKYSDGYRIPTIMETLLGGQHINGGTNFLPNPALLPETSRTWEAGVNISLDDKILANDRLRMKISYFTRKIDNYTAQGPVWDIDPATSLPKAIGTQYVNFLDTVGMQGFEIEALYDAGLFYGGVSASRTYTDLPELARYADKDPYTSPELSGSIVLINAAPQTKLNLDAGFRLFDEKVVVGGRMKYVKPDTQVGVLASGYEATEYTIVDLYGSYEFNENATLRVDVSNLGDVAYVDALTAGGFPSPGRTITAALNFTF
ncbi:TonB-dependent receptor [Pseudovibrio ascidiaceicola]|uniref:TonB-dependent receptor n=1 Tax=Pseudovibrio ascidiaceicola TaxID=285279 RepID=UPI000D692CED|nr:TonB-dependent receptor [Pseudovibrio ascidiaceicola]